MTADAAGDGDRRTETGSGEKYVLRRLRQESLLHRDTDRIVVDYAETGIERVSMRFEHKRCRRMK